MGWIWFGSPCDFAAGTRIYLQDYRTQFVCCGFHSIAHFTFPAPAGTTLPLYRPMALCHPLLASSESTNQTPHLLHEAKQTSKAYCSKICNLIFHHLCYICCFDRWSSRRRYFSLSITCPNFSGNKVPTNIAGSLLTNWGLIQPNNGNPNQTMPANLNASEANSTF
jgi:hypothetical protein